MSWQDKIRNPNCTLCPLHESAEYVCLMGHGPKKAKVMVVGEAPGAREDESHRAFVGPSGQLLREALSKAGIDPAECYITNAAKCRPPENRRPERAELKICSQTYFTQELAKVEPDYILLLGNAALQAIARKSGITKHRGSTFTVGNAVAFATFHPAFVLRSPYHGGNFYSDIERFARLVNGEKVDFEHTKIKIVKTKEQLKWLRSRLMEAPVISLDLETTWHGSWRPDAAIHSISFSWEEQQACVVPLHHAESPWKDWRGVLKFLKPCLERADCKYVGHNGKFDCGWLASCGIFCKLTFDTMLAAHMLEENRLKGLKPLSQQILGADAYAVGEELKDGYNVDLRKLCLYNGKDTDYTLRLYHHFKQQLMEEPRIARVFAKLMMPASNALTHVEAIGPYIDVERFRPRFKKTLRKRDEVEVQLRESCGGINLRSPPQVSKWLFGKKGKIYTVGPKKNPQEVVGLGLPVVKVTDKGAPSTAEDVILHLAKRSPDLKLLLEYRKWESKYVRTYFKAFADRDAKARIHPGYKLFGTVTGRLSGDFQQIPRDSFMRSIIGAPPGWTFAEADYSQIELRIAAWLANEKRLLRIFAEGRDPHMETAVLLTGKHPAEITSEERKKAKSVNFGFLYGMGWSKFIQYAFVNYDLEVSEAEAIEFRRKWHEAYPAFKAWHDRQRRLCQRYQRVHSPIGRVRHLPTVLSSDKGVRAEAERQAINSPVQSLASDIMLLSLVRLVASFRAATCRVVGTVHDSLLFEIRDDAVSETLPLIHSTMTDLTELKRKFGADLRVPIEVEMKVGTHWGEGKIWTPV